MKKTAAMILASVFAAFSIETVRAAVPSSVTECVPGQMNYQGYLADPTTGNPYRDGIYTLECRIYNAASGGTCLWGGKYSVYVKDGYFNIMLGSASGSAVTSSPYPTYTHDLLWKALWRDGSSGNTLYLGVKPFENAINSSIPNPTEITPRQQLLTAPFAFRAERAQYAEQSQGDFSVGGNLSVSGTINATSSSSQRFGPIATTSSSVQLGGSTTASSSMPNIYDVGSYLYFRSYYTMDFRTTVGSMTFTVPASYNFKVTGSGNFVVDTPSTTIGGTGSTTVKGSNASLTSTSGSVTLSSASSIFLSAPTNSSLYVSGKPYIKSNYTGGNFSPFRKYSQRFNVPQYSRDTNGQISSNSVGEYEWFVVGYSQSAYNPITDLHVQQNNSTPSVQIYLQNIVSNSNFSVTVDLLGVHKKLIYVE